MGFTQARIQATARLVVATAFLLVLAGLLLLYFDSPVPPSFELIQCGLLHCTGYYPYVGLLSQSMGTFIAALAILLLVVIALPRLWPVALGSGALVLGTLAYIVFVVAVAHPPLSGYGYSVGTASVLVGGGLAVIASTSLGFAFRPGPKTGSGRGWPQGPEAKTN